jgi:CHASE2 domain-containing sensor protein
MVLAIYFLSVFAALIGLLVLRRVPRRTGFEIVLHSAWIFALASFLSLQVISRVAPRLLDGLVPFMPPVVPVCIFVAWSLHRAKAVER